MHTNKFLCRKPLITLITRHRALSTKTYTTRGSSPVAIQAHSSAIHGDRVGLDGGPPVEAKKEGKMIQASQRKRERMERKNVNHTLNVG